MRLQVHSLPLKGPTVLFGRRDIGPSETSLSSKLAEIRVLSVHGLCMLVLCLDTLPSVASMFVAIVGSVPWLQRTNGDVVLKALASGRTLAVNGVALDKDAEVCQAIRSVQAVIMPANGLVSFCLSRAVYVPF